MIMFLMGVISLSTLGTKGAMFAVWAEGLDQIRQIKAGMNTGRKFEA